VAEQAVCDDAMEEHLAGLVRRSSIDPGLLDELVGATGFQVRRQRLARLTDGSLYIKILPDGDPAVVLVRPTDGTVIRLIPQRTYTHTSKPARSTSFNQIPDVSVEVQREGEDPVLYLFDPKYKLQSEDLEAQRAAKPKKVDIDAMHAYRDAIRTPKHGRVVRYAATLYPGPQVAYGEGLEALPARPDEPKALRLRLREVLTAAATE
jgi:hypothetical protein